MKKTASLILGSLILLLVTTNSEAAVAKSLIQAVIQVESSGRPYVESRDGCRGLGQIEKRTWYWICEMMGVSWDFDEAFEPEKNKRVTQYYLNWLENYLKKRKQYSLDLLLASYNAGPSAVKKYGWRIPPYYETIHYIKKVKKELAKNY